MQEENTLLPSGNCNCEPSERTRLVYKKAYEYEKQFEGCSQPLLLAIFDVLGLENDMMLKAVSGFAGGISRMKSVCGALLTGILAIGLKYGREPKELDRFDKLLNSYPPVQSLVKWFEAEYGSSNCYQITGIDLSDTERRDVWFASGGAEKCNILIAKTAAKTLELMEQND